MFKLSEKSKQRRKGVDHRLIEICDLALQISVIDFGIPGDGGVRTTARQNELFTEGKSKADGYVKRSRHQPALDGSGKALDFYAFVDGKASWDHAHLAMVGAAFLQAASMLGYKLKWGGLWRRRKPKFINGIPYGWDMPHVQLDEG